MTAQMTDEAAMTLALQQAELAMYTTTPNPRVGCVIVKDQAVIGRGHTQPPGGHHAEIEALADARARGRDVRGATVYVTLEPCSHFGRTPPCTDALIAARVSRVVFAVQDPNPQVRGQGAEALRQAGIVVESGLMEAEAVDLNIGFMKRMTYGQPW